MTPSDVKLAALIGSRICHDLISPIGAINNGLELLGMTGAANGPEFDLISESVENASARIRFFRIAFGAAGQQELGQSEVRGVLEDMMGAGRVSVEYHPNDPQPRAMIRLVFLAILCLENALPYGGRIAIIKNGDEWQLLGQNGKLNLDMSLWSVLADPTGMADIAPAHVQFALLPTLAQEDGRRLYANIADDSVEIRF